MFCCRKEKIGEKGDKQKKKKEEKEKEKKKKRRRSELGLYSRSPSWKKYSSTR